MRKVLVGTLCVILLGMGAAQAQQSIAENPDLALEQLLVFRLVQQADLDPSSMAEVFGGYQQYREGMDAMREKRAALLSEIKDAIAANKGGYELTQKVNSLMSLDQQILSAGQQGVREAGTLLDAVTQAQLYLLVSERDRAIADARAALGGTPVCPKAALAECPKAAQAAAAEKVAEAAPEIDPKELILQGVKTFGDKLTAADVPGTMAMVSDSFAHYEYGDKAGLQEFLQGAADMGYLSGLDVSVKDAEVKVEGDKATVYPVEISGSFGSATLELVLGKANGTWALTGLDISGI